MEIKFNTLFKLVHNLESIWLQCDEDIPNKRIIVANERAVSHWLDKVTLNSKTRYLIIELCRKHLFDKTFKNLVYDLELNDIKVRG